MPEHSKSWQRREILKATGAASAVSMAGFAGCAGNGDDTGGEEDYPSKPIRLIIPFSQGGGTDTINRVLVPILSDKLGVNIEIDNVEGAASMRGTQEGIQADPDGYTILAFNPPSTPISYLVNQPDFDLTSVEGIASYAIAPAVVTVNPDVADDYGIETYSDLVDTYQEGQLEAFAGQSVGSYFHVMALLMRKRHGLDFNPEKYVAYSGTGPAVESVASGETPAGIGIDTATAAFSEDDRLDIPAVITSEGSNVYPDTPTIPDEGFDNIDAVGQVTRCYWAPPDTPDHIINTLTESVEEMVNDPEIEEYAEEEGQQMMYQGPEYADNLLSEILNDIPNEVDLESIREEVQE